MQLSASKEQCNSETVLADKHGTCCRNIELPLSVNIHRLFGPVNTINHNHIATLKTFTIPLQAFFYSPHVHFQLSEFAPKFHKIFQQLPLSDNYQRWFYHFHSALQNSQYKQARWCMIISTLCLAGKQRTLLSCNSG